jgi:primosomal protein N' (replication factor Y)
MAFAIALAATWIAAPAGSQIRPEPGQPLDLDAEARAIGQLVTAAEVADWARDRRDAEAMLVASRMMGEVRNRFQSGDAPFLTSAVLLQEAETLAADDPDILERVRRQQSPNKGVRSSPFGPGPIVLVRRLRARETYSFTVEARRDEVLRVAAIGDGDTNIDLTIRDAEGVVCRWCGRIDAALRCRRCGADAIRAVVVGARRTAEELGRAFAGTPVITSAGDAVHTEIGPGPALVVATPGAEPRAPDGYGAALLLDSWSLLGRPDLRAAEDTLRRWMTAAAQVHSRSDGGVVAVVADSAIPTVQALIRWDPLAHAEAELDGRASVGLPPAVHMAAVDGASAAVDALIATAQLPPEAEVLGPVDLPAGVRRPPGAGEQVIRMLIRVRRDEGLALAAALRAATAVRSARHDGDAVRVQIDPLHIG